MSQDNSSIKKFDNGSSKLLAPVNVCVCVARRDFFFVCLLLWCVCASNDEARLTLS